MIPKTSVPEIIWPPIADPRASVLLSLLFQLQQSQWWSPEEIQTQQYRQLNALMAHAIKTVPYYQKQFQTAQFPTKENFTSANWLDVPLLTRTTLIKSAEDLVSSAIPKDHGKVVKKKTSGSTGNSISTLATEVTGLLWHAFTLRDHHWHGRNTSDKLVSIRSGRYVKDPNAVLKYTAWGMAPSLIYQDGPATLFFNRLPIKRQVDLLLQHEPNYLLTYPSNVSRLAHYFQRNELSFPSLKQVITYGGPTSQHVKTACDQIWGVKAVDTYSTEEVGCIALQCPDTDNYHIQSESILVEVIDAEGLPCKPGKIGRVILTALHNFAMPLIRYEIGDYAEVGTTCPCGRGLPTLKRILGRKRNQITLPGGEQGWPESIKIHWQEFKITEPIQVIQKTTEHLQINIVAEKPLTQSKEKKLKKTIQKTLGHPFECNFVYLNEIPYMANGKFEPFISELID